MKKKDLTQKELAEQQVEERMTGKKEGWWRNRKVTLTLIVLALIAAVVAFILITGVFNSDDAPYYQQVTTKNITVTHTRVPGMEKKVTEWCNASGKTVELWAKEGKKAEKEFYKEANKKPCQPIVAEDKKEKPCPEAKSEEKKAEKKSSGKTTVVEKITKRFERVTKQVEKEYRRISVKVAEANAAVTVAKYLNMTRDEKTEKKVDQNNPSVKKIIQAMEDYDSDLSEVIALIIIGRRSVDKGICTKQTASFVKSALYTKWKADLDILEVLTTIEVVRETSYEETTLAMVEKSIEKAASKK